jgi:hypothetical protein
VRTLCSKYTKRGFDILEESHDSPLAIISLGVHEGSRSEEDLKRDQAEYREG